jgi:hypothetical protein
LPNVPVVDLVSLASFLGPVGGRVTLTVLVGALLLRRVTERAIRRRLGEARARSEGSLIEARFDDRYSAYRLRNMNNDELPVERGYPVRLMVSGLYGYVSATKWLTGMELADRGFVRTASSAAGPRRSP